MGAGGGGFFMFYTRPQDKRRVHETAVARGLRRAFLVADMPFMSYGSNSLIVCMLAIAMLARIQYENRRGEPDGGEPWLRG